MEPSISSAPPEQEPDKAQLEKLLGLLTKHSKHARSGPYRDSRGALIKWHHTRQRPWVKRKRNRIKNRIAKASRKANR